MKGKIAKTRFEETYTTVQVWRIVVAVFRRALNAFDRFTRDAIVNDIDDTANRATPIEQRGGSSQDLNALCQQRFHGYSMVRAETGDIRRRRIVLQGNRTRTLLPTDNRAPHPRPKR